MSASSILKILAASTCLACVSATSAATAATNLLTNGDFATGDLTGWSLSVPSTLDAEFTQVTDNFGRGCFPTATHCFYAKGGDLGNSVDLSQSFHEKAGAHLTIRFQFGQQIVPSRQDSFSVLLNGVTLGTFTTASVVDDQFVTLHGLSAGSNTLDFKIEEINSGGANLIGGVSVSAPEPASWALMITGFGLTGAALRRRVPKTA